MGPGRRRLACQGPRSQVNAGDVGIYLLVEEALTPEGMTMREPRVGITIPPANSDSITLGQARQVIESLTAALAAADSLHALPRG